MNEAILVVVNDVSLSEVKFLVRRFAAGDAKMDNIDVTIKNIEETYQDATERSYQILVKWKEMAGNEATVAKLIDGLMESGKTTTVEKLQQKLPDSHTNKDMRSLTMEGMCAWLRRHSIDDQTISVFRENGVTGRDMMEIVTEETLVGADFNLKSFTAKKIIQYRDQEMKTLTDDRQPRQTVERSERTSTTVSSKGVEPAQSPEPVANTQSRRPRPKTAPVRSRSRSRSSAIATTTTGNVDNTAAQVPSTKPKERSTIAQEALERVPEQESGNPGKGTFKTLFGEGSGPTQFRWAMGVYVKRNGLWVVCDTDNHRVQVIDPIKLCCDLILQFPSLPTFSPYDVTVNEDTNTYFICDEGNDRVVASSERSEILNSFGQREDIQPLSIGLSCFGFLFVGDGNGYVRKYNQSGEHITMTEKGQVKSPWGLIVNDNCVFASDEDKRCVHVLSHRLVNLRKIGKGCLHEPWGLCFNERQNGIYVCDWIKNRLVELSFEGRFQRYVGENVINGPYHIALCKDTPYRLVVQQGDCIKLLYM
ncbi:uncharacterized protein [Ptychodera flava]|uniref:uncharacterized protein isoform X2 n=1 Tax=Ptychodera flava TaxID=63121 RepID=UPI00396A5830